MQIEAIQLGESLNIKRFSDKFKLKALAKDPFTLKWGEKSHAVLFKYGVIVLWNFNEEEKKTFLKQIKPFVVQALDEPIVESARYKKGKELGADDGVIQSKALDLPSMQLISVSLARTVIMDFFENEVDGLLIDFSKMIAQFTRSGRPKVKDKKLLQLAGAAMSINNRTVSQMALLDKPDFTWDDPELDSLYSELEEEYEISDRYSVLSKKIETLFHDAEFIMNYLEGRRATMLEAIIVLLFIVDIVLIILEKAL